MANFYCDISAIGNEYQAYTDTPTTWAVPQDGNGKAGPGHAAAVAISTIDVAGCTATSGSIGVMGVSLTGLNATGSALATAIAAAINASATAVSATYSALLLPLNKLVYARVNPGLDTQVQIMLRIAGVDWVGFTPTQASISPAATISNFAGGANGPFGYIMETASVFGRTAIIGYGIWAAASAGVDDPGMTDCIDIRTQRGGVNFDISVEATGSVVGHNWRSTNYIYDNGTVWSGDNGRLSVTLWFNTTGSSVTWSIGVIGSSGATVSHVSRGMRNLDLIWRTNSGSSSHNLHTQNANKRSVWVRCGIIQYAISSAYARFYTDIGGSTGGVTVEVIDCFVHCKQVIRTVINSTASGSSNCVFKLNGTTYEIESATGPIAPIISVGQGAQNRLEYVGGRVYDTNGVYNCANPFSINVGNTTIDSICDSVFGITDAAVGFTASDANQARSIWTSPDGPYKGFRHETPQFTVDWKDDGTFPQCGGQRLGGEYWSHRVTWTSVPSLGRSITPIKLATFHRDTTAIRTIRIDVYLPDAIPAYLHEFDVAAAYIDDTGTPRVDIVPGTNDRGMVGSSTPIIVPTSATAWTANGVTAHTARKLELTTQYPVLNNSEIAIRLTLCAPRTPSTVFYVSPRVVVT